jgi:uncharacterized phage-associated protein
VPIRFRFNIERAIETLAYLLKRLGKTDKAKLMKLVYLADRAHFIRHGYPITGDSQFAMPLGPVPSGTLDLINGNLPAAHGRVFRHIHVDDSQVELRQEPSSKLLGAEEHRVLDEVIATYGKKSTWALVRETHALPEYAETYVEGTSKPIPYERIAKHSGNDARFRMNRPVISAETAARVECPFPPDSDL